MTNQNVDEIFTELSKISYSVVCGGIKCNNCIAHMDNKSQWNCLFNNFDDIGISSAFIRPEDGILRIERTIQRLRCCGVRCNTCKFSYIEEDTDRLRCKVIDVSLFFRDLGVLQ